MASTGRVRWSTARGKHRQFALAMEGSWEPTQSCHTAGGRPGPQRFSWPLETQLPTSQELNVLQKTLQSIHTAANMYSTMRSISKSRRLGMAALSFPDYLEGILSSFSPANLVCLRWPLVCRC
jgi:hypothetical protein